MLVHFSQHKVNGLKQRLDQQFQLIVNQWIVFLMIKAQNVILSLVSMVQLIQFVFWREWGLHSW